MPKTSEEMRSRNLNIRLTEYEYQVLQEGARIESMPLTIFARRAIKLYCRDNLKMPTDPPRVITADPDWQNTGR